MSFTTAFSPKRSRTPKFLNVLPGVRPFSGESYTKILTISGKVNNKPLQIILDTGAASNVISQQLLPNFIPNNQITRFLTGPGNNKIPILGTAQFDLKISSLNTTCNAVVIPNFGHSLILGTQFMST